MCDQFEGIGVTRNELQPGTIVLVAVGRIAALVNGHPCVIAPAEVMRPASDDERRTYKDPDVEVWWLNVFTAPGVHLPQMYRVDEILGLPALSLQIRP
jgi:hypothetical protein